MSLRLHYHPLSSFCWKVLIALYENDTPFEPVLVDLGNTDQREAFYRLWPIGKFPVIEDTAREWMVPESTIIIEYLAQHHPGPVKLVPTDPDLARQVRMRDRFFDLHIHLHMQKIVGDRIRPKDKQDPFGVEDARRQIRVALGMVEGEIASKRWVMGDAFTMADCAAAPALYYINLITPLAGDFPNATAYLKRLIERSSFARVLQEAEPYKHLFPKA